MFVLDTNVVSELMRNSLDPRVIAWVDDQSTSDLYVTAITEAEIRAGIAFLPTGERRRGLTAAADALFVSCSLNVSCRSIATPPASMQA